MNQYVFQKIHCSAEIIRNSNDGRTGLCKALEMELSNIDVGNLPVKYEDRISSLLKKLTLTDEIPTINGMGRAQAMVNFLNDEDINSITKEIFELEKILEI